VNIEKKMFFDVVVAAENIKHFEGGLHVKLKNKIKNKNQKARGRRK
jgi:hypothetical protein